MTALTEGARPDEADYLKPLLDEVRLRGPVVHQRSGVVGIFDPVLAIQVDATNAEALYIPASPADFLRPAGTRSPVAWREVRPALIEQNRRLAAPAHVKLLHERMRSFLSQHLDRKQDLTWLVGRAASFALVPLILDGLERKDFNLLLSEQEMRFRTLLTPMNKTIPRRQRVANFLLSRRATRAIARQVQRRRDGRTAPREDLVQALLMFADRLSVGRITYLVTTLLTAASAAPGTTASCLLYAMYRYPQWREKIRNEIATLEPGELYSLPTAKLPATLRFIKEAMRLWAFPLVTHRVSACDIDIDGVRLKNGQQYDLSSYVLHRSGDYWSNPDNFEPDRWLPPNKPAKGAYVPFGFGPRTCIGASVGHAQLVLACELFAHSLNFDIVPEIDPRIRMEGFAVPENLIGTITRAV